MSVSTVVSQSPLSVSTDHGLISMAVTFASLTCWLSSSFVVQVHGSSMVPSQKVTDYLLDDHILVSRHMAMELEVTAESTRIQLGIFFLFRQDQIYRILDTNVHA